jgi:hypothetical protein
MAATIRRAELAAALTVVGVDGVNFPTVARERPVIFTTRVVPSKSGNKLTARNLSQSGSAASKRAE